MEWSPPEYFERKPSGALVTIAERLWCSRARSLPQFERGLPLPFVHLILNLSEPYTVRQLDGVSVAQASRVHSSPESSTPLPVPVQFPLREEIRGTGRQLRLEESTDRCEAGAK